MTKSKKYRDLILDNVHPINEVIDNRIAPFNWLSEQIYAGKAQLKINTVDFIIAKILQRNDQIYNFQKKLSFDLFVIGYFRKAFNPTYRVAEALTDFYLEMRILPNIIAIPKNVLMKAPKLFVNKFRNGVLIYERG